RGAGDGEEDDEPLTDVVVQAGLRGRPARERVGGAQERGAVGGDRGEDADAAGGAWEGLAAHDDLGQAQLAADRPDLVLEQLAQRLDELELQVVRQSAHDVVALDVRGAGAAAGLHDVRVEGALDAELDGRAGLVARVRPELCGRLPERGGALAAYDLPLLLRVRHAVELAQERVDRVDGHEAHAGRADEVLLDLLPLPLTQQSVIDEHARELIAHRLVYEG